MNRAGEIGFAALVLTPLITLSGTGEDALRTVWVAAFGGLLIWRVAWSVARRRQRGMGLHPLVVAAGALVLFQILGLAGSANAWEGLPHLFVTAGAIAACGVLATGYFKRSFLIQWGLWAFPAAAIAIAGIGIAQAISGGPAVSTLGSTIRSGAVAAILAPVCGALVFVGKDPVRRGLAALGCLASLALVYLSDSRAAMGAAALGGLVTIGVLLLRRDTPGRKFIAVGVVLLILPVLFRIDRAATIFSAEHETNRVRLGIWPGATRLALQYPVFGCGPGNFRIAYPPHRDDVEYRIHNQGAGHYAEVEDAHGTIFQIWSEGGFLSLIAFLWVLYIAFRLGRYHWKNAEDPDGASAYAAVAGGIVAFLVAALTSSLDQFAGPWVLFWLLIGLTEALGIDRKKRRTQQAGEIALAVPIMGGILALFAVYYSVMMAVADSRYVYAKRAPVPVEALQSSLDVFHPQWRVHADLGFQLAVHNRFADAEAHLLRALELHPNSIMVLENLGRVSSARQKPDEALKWFDRAIEIAPFRSTLYYNRAIVRGDLGDSDGVQKDTATIVGIADTYYIEKYTQEAQRLCRLIVKYDEEQQLGMDLKNDPVVKKILGGE